MSLARVSCGSNLPPSPKRAAASADENADNGKARADAFYLDSIRFEYLGSSAESLIRSRIRKAGVCSFGSGSLWVCE
jgi:hypothetical protein